MTLVLALALVLGLQTPAPLTLLIRVFDGAEEVTAESRVNIFKRGRTTEPPWPKRAPDSVVETSVPQGMYDAQVIREREGACSTSAGRSD